MTGFAPAVDEYLAIRRAFGSRLERPGQLLAQFATFLDEREAPVLTIELALAWATQPSDAERAWWSRRLGAVRPFARWLATIDPATEVPPPGLLPHRSRRIEPYPYTDEDIAGLLAAARSIRHPLRAATYETLIGLLVVTGMRVGEAIALDRADVDLGAGVLLVRHPKFDRQRELVLHPTTTAALTAYAAIRARQWPSPPTAAFFVSLTGTRLRYANVQHCYAALTRRAGLEPRSSRCRPRIHDLRH